MKVTVILGTRPEIVKMSPVIRELENQGLDYFILHSNQHYSYKMDRVFFEQLRLPEPKYNLNVGSGSHAEETGKMLIGIESVLKREKPDVILVEGDTNTVLAGALAACKLMIKVGHIEAGLRSYDRRMPEETNRVLADHCSDMLFAPTEKSRKILVHEGIPDDKIFVTGNTIVDAVHQNLELSKKKEDALNQLGITKSDYFLVTLHRQENVDNKERFQGILRGLQMIKDELNLQGILPIHPRTKKQMEAFNIQLNSLRLVEPLDYLSFLQLEKNAKLILTDSGGVQEEACILKVPCVTLRDNTERPETLEVGSNTLAGTNPDTILAETKRMLNKKRDWVNPFGDGRAGERIVQIISREICPRRNAIHPTRVDTQTNPTKT